MISNKEDSLQLAIEKFSITKAITKPFLLKKKGMMLAFDYTAEDFYGDSGDIFATLCMAKY